ALALQVPPTLGYLVQCSGYGVVLYGVVNWLGDRPWDGPVNQTAEALPLGAQDIPTYHLPEQDSSDRRWWVLQGVGLGGFVATIVGWVAWGMARGTLAEPINPFPLGDPDFGAGYLVLLLPLWAVLMGGRGNAWVRSGWAAIAGLGGGLLYTTGSPVGAVGILVLLLALVSIFVMAPVLGADRSPDRRRRIPLWAWSLAGVLGWLGAIVGHPRWPGWGNWGSLARDPWSWETGWTIWRDHPLWGIGLGNMALVYDAYRPLAATVSSVREVALSSTPLQLAAELGLIGVGLYLVWLGVLGWLWLRATVALDRAWELWRQQEADPGRVTPLGFQRARLQGDRLLCRGCGASVLAYAGGSLLDFQLENLPISLTLVLVTALLISLNQSYGGSIVLGVDRTVWRLQQLPLVLLAIWLGLWFSVDGAMALGRSGMQALRQGEIETFYDRWAAAAERVPWDAYYDFQIGAQLSQYVEQLNAQRLPEELPTDAAAIEKERTFREDLLRKARRHLQFAVQKVPADVLFHRYLGFFLVDVDPRAVAPPLVRAFQVAPRQSFLAAQLAIAQGYLLPPEPGAGASEGEGAEAGDAAGDATGNTTERPEAGGDAATTAAGGTAEAAAPTDTPALSGGSGGSGGSDGPSATDATDATDATEAPEEGQSAERDPRHDLIKLTLALEGLVNPAFLLNNTASVPDLQPFWLDAIGQTIDRYDRALGTLTAADPDYIPLLENRTLLAWWQAQQQQQPFDWAALAPEDFLKFNLRVRSIAAIDQNQPQAALEILEFDQSAAAALLRAWIAPDRFLSPLLDSGLLSPVLANQTDTLVRILQEGRSLPDWLLSLGGETRLQVQGLGFLFYRNTNGPDGVVLPGTVPLNTVVASLDLFAPIGKSEAFDRVILETQGLLIQNLTGLGLLRPSAPNR
ncbi:MAG: O-antigen ligase family protein, partial [Prochlorothrix sp.]